MTGVGLADPAVILLLGPAAMPVVGGLVLLVLAHLPRGRAREDA